MAKQQAAKMGVDFCDYIEALVRNANPQKFPAGNILGGAQ